MNSACFIIFDAFEYHQARNTQKYFSFTAVNLLLEDRVLLAESLDVSAEFYYLLPSFRIRQMILPLAPGTLVNLNELNQLRIVSELRIQ